MTQDNANNFDNANNANNANNTNNANSINNANNANNADEWLMMLMNNAWVKQEPHDRSVLLRLKIIRSRTIKDAPTFSFQGGSRRAFVTLVLSLEDTEVSL